MMPLSFDPEAKQNITTVTSRQTSLKMGQSDELGSILGKARSLQRNFTQSWASLGWNLRTDLNVKF